MQRLILELLLPYLPVHENAFAYVEGKSIKRNALMHRNNEYFLKMDFSDFFNSIKPIDLRNVLFRNGYETIPHNLNLIDNLFFYKKQKSGLSLSVGAPSSPLISNAVLYDFDVRVSELCKRRYYIYKVCR